MGRPVIPQVEANFQFSPEETEEGQREKQITVSIVLPSRKASSWISMKYHVWVAGAVPSDVAGPG